jgi:hypothetical protein
MAYGWQPTANMTLIRTLWKQAILHHPCRPRSRNENRQSKLVMSNKRKIFRTTLCLGLSAIVPFTGCAGNQKASMSGQQIDDWTLQRQVCVALENNPGYEFSEVKVNVHSGTVQLSGLVDTSDEKSKASEIANNVQNVTTVKNNITLMTQESLSAQ